MSEANEQERRWESSPRLVQRGSISPLRDAARRAITVGLDDRDSIASLQQCVRAARVRGTRTEEVVLALRTVWYDTKPDSRWASTPAVRALRDATPNPELLRLIGIALDAYFQPGGSLAH
jgi:hypothetical protein